MATASKITAYNLRIILGCLLVIVIAAVSFGAYFALSTLNVFAEDVNKTYAEAATSSKRLEDIKTLANYLDKNRDQFNNARQVIAESSKYKYQDAIISDFRVMASQADVTVNAYEFVEDTGKGASAGAASKSKPALTTTPSGLKSKKVLIMISNANEYYKILDFIHIIEQNLTRMQLQSVNISGSSTPGGALLEPILTVEVYTK